MANKQCSTCKQLLSLNLFHKHLKTPTGYRGQCKHCRKLTDIRYNTKRSLVRKLIREQSPKLTKKEQKRLRWKTDLNFKLKELIRNRMNLALKHECRNSSSWSYIQCNLDEFKFYIQSKFQDEMSWNNHGLKGWHIDHIKPLSSFNLKNETELKQAWHYTNLQPLWALDNIRKGAKYA